MQHDTCMSVMHTHMTCTIVSNILEHDLSHSLTNRYTHSHFISNLINSQRMVQMLWEDHATVVNIPQTLLYNHVASPSPWHLWQCPDMA